MFIVEMGLNMGPFSVMREEVIIGRLPQDSILRISDTERIDLKCGLIAPSSFALAGPLDCAGFHFPQLPPCDPRKRTIENEDIKSRQRHSSLTRQPRAFESLILCYSVWSFWKSQ